MKINQNILKTSILLFIVSVNNLFCQTDTTRALFKKNEIGLNVGPVILVTLGGTPYSQPLGITYKRVLNKWAFRANYTYKPYDNSWFGNFENISKVTDTTQINKTTSRRSQSQIIRVGFEYRHKFKRGWYLTGGIDLSGQYTESSRQINEATFKIDSIVNKGTAEEYYQISFKDSRNLLNENTFTRQLGLGLTIGAMIPAGKRWWFVAQFRADGFFGPSTTTTTDKITGKTMKNSSTTFDFNTGPAISEFSLFYRF